MVEPVSLKPANKSSPFASMTGDHAGIRVPDFDAAARWYVEKLDFRIVQEWPYGNLRLAYVVPAVDDHFKFEILAGAGARDRAGYTDLNDSLSLSGWHHLCIRVDSVEDTVAELRRRGVTIVTEPFVLDVIKRKLAFFADPWDNLFELAEVLS